MKSKIVKIFIVPVLGIFFLTSAIIINANINDPIVASASNDDNVIVKANQMTKSDMKLTVTQISFGSQPFQDDPEFKTAEVLISFGNINGKDRAFVPKGYIAAFVGSSGKVYDLKTDESIEKSYKMTREVAKQYAKEKNELYSPGEFKIGKLLQVDADEETFTKVIYQDEKGNKTEIPIDGMKPKIKISNPDAK
ncbi:hypothetical protein [Desulfosporosinus shakirovi]|uniref:hypothetical protein n=1 Tax=Desulfosporosinus shakirovi TaxID=2885154 RepID=UPI001E395515|nr:hypothetical protein [Desulfosporosinus sp. SRJS8]MCB8818100.1 hypothetical protein [Desulfosporosinus sp. SRJS8]